MIVKLKQSPVLCLFFIIYLFTFVVGYLNPMQSDDFSFYLRGLSFSQHWDFYMTWSGRFIVDYLSTLLLAINNHLIITLINSLAVPLLIYHLAAIAFYKNPHYRHDRGFIMAVIILWWGYWLTNPALGQTTFWVVGSANYLWPLVFLAVFFRYLLAISYQSSSSALSKKQCLFICVFAVLVGCSNEATGALAFCCLVLLYGWAHINRLNKRIILYGFIFVLASYLFLLLAPGNMVRAASGEYAHWRAMGLNERIVSHVTVTIPQLLKNYGVIYLLLIWALVRGYKPLTKVDRQLLFIFLIGFCVFCFILIASPHASIARTQLTGLFFLLLILSFLLKNIFYDQRERLFNNILFYMLAITFIFSYGCVVNAYYSFYQQSKFRIDTINQDKAKALHETLVPNYYRPYVLREGDYPELSYHDPYSMGSYYGIKKVNLVFVEFDYLAVLSRPCTVGAEVMASKGIPLVKCIDIQKLPFEDVVRVVVEFSPQIASASYPHHFAVKLSNLFDRSDERYYEVTLPLRIVKIGAHYFASVDVVASLLAVDKEAALSLQLKGIIKENGKDVDNAFIKFNL